VDEDQLSGEDYYSFKFHFGYTYFRNNEAQKALENLIPVSENENMFQEDGSYYLGFIHYEKKEWNKALSYFKRLEDSSKYKYVCSTYIAQILYYTGRFDEAIQYVDRRIKHSTSKEHRNLIAVKGMSLVQIKDYDAAITAYNKYESLGGRLQNEDLYHLGFAHMEKGAYAKAVKLFRKINTKDEVLTQNTSHHLGTSLLAMGYRGDAMLAFQRAVELDKDPQISQEAHFNYAKLAYEEGDVFGNSQQALQSFIDKYPNSEYINDVYGYLVNNYLNQKEYSKAISSLEITGLKDLKLRKAYQEICYFRAIQLFNDGKYWPSIEHLNKSMTQHIDRKISSQSMFWKAEAYYRLNKIPQSINTFEKFLKDPNSKNTEEYNKAFYNVGYAYLRNKNYQQAAKSFDRFSKKGNQAKNIDAIVRSADAHFMLQDYGSAKGQYRRAAEKNSPESDYASFQEAVCVSLLGDHKTKVEILKNFKETYPKSLFNDEALLELGNAYFALLQYEDAVFSYERMLNAYPNSIHISRAELKIGLVHMNSNQNEKAVTVFKDIVHKYGASEVSKEALRNIRNIYIEDGQVAQYANYIANIEFANESVTSLDSTAYQSAELQFLKGDYIKAELSFESYLENYPKGYFVIPANYHLAQVYLKNDKKDKALTSFKEVVKDQNSAFKDESNLNLAELEYTNGNFQEALNYYTNLASEAQYPKYLQMAEIGKMRCQYQLEQYTLSMESAKAVIASNASAEDILIEGNYILAKSAYMNNSLKLAKGKFEWLKENVEGEKQAEAFHYIARIYFMQKEYTDSKEEVYAQAKAAPGYKRWLAKSLMLLSQNLHALDDTQNAIYTLEQVIKNYAADTDVVEEAEMLKETYTIAMQKKSVDQ
jgi:TolA-binding protein